MKMEVLSAHWLAETEQIIDWVQHTFIQLNEKQLTNNLHVSHCNIRQLMEHVLSNNQRLLACIECAILRAESIGIQKEYNPSYLGKYILNQIGFTMCTAKIKSNEKLTYGKKSAETIFLEIIDQQNRLKDLITLCKSLDMNSRIVPFRLFGLIKLSIAEIIDFLILDQKKHFIMARHIRMLQQY